MRKTSIIIAFFCIFPCLILSACRDRQTNEEIVFAETTSTIEEDIETSKIEIIKEEKEEIHEEYAEQDVVDTVEESDMSQDVRTGSEGLNVNNIPKALTAMPIPVEEEQSKDLDDKELVLNPLKQELQEIVNAQEGIWDIYVYDFETGDELLLNGAPMTAASLIKLFVAGAYYDAVYRSQLEDTASDSIDLMISESDNESCNYIIDLLGVETINAFISKSGYVDTLLTRKMLEQTGTENETSVDDCGRIFREIYNKEFISPEVSNRLLRDLEAQSRRHKIPAGLPADIKTANKTGELADVENDVAIVYGNHCTYIVCIMSMNLPSATVGQQLISELSRIIYEYMDSDSSIDAEEEASYIEESLEGIN